MPEGYEPAHDGIFAVVPRTDRQGNPVRPKNVRVSYGPLAVVGKYASVGGEQWFDLARHDGVRTVTRQVTGAVPRSGGKLVLELANAGILLRSMIYAYPTFHRAVEEAVAGLVYGTADV